jgi:hypothetical protein
MAAALMTVWHMRASNTLIDFVPIVKGAYHTEVVATTTKYLGIDRYIQMKKDMDYFTGSFLLFQLRMMMLGLDVGNTTAIILAMEFGLQDRITDFELAFDIWLGELYKADMSAE